MFWIRIWNLEAGSEAGSEFSSGRGFVLVLPMPAETTPLVYGPGPPEKAKGGKGGRQAAGGWSASACCASVLGPGMLVSLADSDAGCLIVAADSGARWGYSLVALQIVLVPVLFLAQELTVRVGVATQQGHTACIFKRFGKFWGWVTLAALVTSCIGATVSEMSGLAGVAQLWGLSDWLGALLASVVLVVVPASCTYAQVEVIGVSSAPPAARVSSVCRLPARPCAPSA